MDGVQHGAHMEQMKEGLHQILQSEDINQIKQIAQQLLSAEEGEQQGEEMPSEGEGGEMAQRVMNRLKQGE